jgi:hypothetical protein
MKNSTEQTAPANSFARLLIDHREGQTQDELSEALAQLVTAVRQTGKSGTLNLTIKVSAASKGAGWAVSITDKVKVTLPQLDRESSIMFASEDGALHRDNPLQKKLDLKEVQRPAEAIPLRQAVNG